MSNMMTNVVGPCLKSLRRTRNLVRHERPRLSARFMHLFYGLPEIQLEELTGTAAQPSEPPILEHACLPPHFGPCDHDDLGPFLAVLTSHSPRLVLELGTAYGNLTANICRYCPDAAVYSVNALADQQTGQVTTYSLSPEDIGMVYRRYGYADRVVQIFSNTLSLNLGSYLEEAVVDLAIIDACHDTDYVLNDFHKVRKFMRPGGIVLLHDTHPSLYEHLVGSYLACMKLRQRGYDIRHLSNTWWAVWWAR